MNTTPSAGTRFGVRAARGADPGQTPDPRRRRLSALPLMLLLCTVAPGNMKAQEGLVDRVVAVVGDSIVLLTDIVQEEQQMQAQGIRLPPEGTPQRDSIRRGIVDRIVEVQIILQAAARDTLLEVNEEQVEEELNAVMAQIEGSFANRSELDRALAMQGMTMQSLREMRREQIRQQQLFGLYVRLNAGQGAVEVSEEEIREAFEAGRATFGERPATVTFKQALMRVVPSDSARTVAMSRAEELLERARAGEDFAELASAHSQDPGSAAAGGDVGWFRRGQMADAFEEAAFALPEGVISDVVESEYGFHVILVERIRPSERKARHILIRPVTSFADITMTRELAEEVVERAQSEDFQTLVDQYGDPETADSFTVAIRDVAPPRFPAAYVAALSQRVAGEIVGPVEFNDFGQDFFVVIKIIEVREAGAYTFEDVRDGLRERLIEQKRVQALVEALRAKTYIEIKGF
ncbi:MAG: hypothetical protein F4139_15510 [Gemmatimonadetes bacterium]|nr:hypothetical protein [Gemmatimonadota bacterium]MYA65529.1 hypothetical protein [Gemmatimonadota bacterium]MYB99126.1 hypothetical protein [Gemmatimonadota bacterium]MYH54324.1 hypothetical protein [Gemmatimonadota bacterium]MYI46180.1 hypothetical protein [Gemmatimonadota bacterium]